MADRPEIPEPIKREVRQRCGFGCVLCGNPIIDYDHIYGYEEEHGHRAGEITLLCPEHHRDKTHKRLALETVVRANEMPFNYHNENSKAKCLEFRGGSGSMFVGDNYAWSGRLKERQFVPVIGVDGEPLLGFGRFEGRLLFFVRLFNEFNEPVLTIVDNELRYHSLAWDIRFEGNALSVNEAHRKIALEIEVNMPSRIRVRRARFLYNGVEIVVQRNGKVVVGNLSLGANLVAGASLLLVGRGWSRRGGISYLGKVNRYQQKTLASEAWSDETAEDQ